MRPSNKPFAALRRVMNRSEAIEYCDFCRARLADNHPHVLVLADRQLACACGACAILFSGEGTGKYRRVPQRALHLADFHLTEAQWESLAVPIGLAFFVHSSTVGQVVAYYPSPAGATECTLEPRSWNEVARDNPVLNEIEPDVEALLINRTGQARDYYVAPIDECYKLVGIVRTAWRGLSGGPEVTSRIQGFFDGFRQRARERGERSGA